MPLPRDKAVGIHVHDLGRWCAGCPESSHQSSSRHNVRFGATRSSGTGPWRWQSTYLETVSQQYQSIWRQAHMWQSSGISLEQLTTVTLFAHLQLRFFCSVMMSWSWSKSESEPLIVNPRIQGGRDCYRSCNHLITFCPTSPGGRDLWPFASKTKRWQSATKSSTGMLIISGGFDGRLLQVSAKKTLCLAGKKHTFSLDIYGPPCSVLYPVPSTVNCYYYCFCYLIINYYYITSTDPFHLP